MDELSIDPIGTVKRIYAHFGLRYTEAFEAALQVYIAENGTGDGGRPSPSPAGSPSPSPAGSPSPGDPGSSDEPGRPGRPGRPGGPGTPGRPGKHDDPAHATRDNRLTLEDVGIDLAELERTFAAYRSKYLQ